MSLHNQGSHLPQVIHFNYKITMFMWQSYSTPYSEKLINPNKLTRDS